MTNSDITALIASVQFRRRPEAGIGPRSNPSAHAQLVADYEQLEALGYTLNHSTDEWEKS